MKQLIRLSGNARQVFNYMELLSRYNGKTTLKELEKENKTIRLSLKKK